MVNSKKKQVNFRLPATLIDALKALAEAESTNVTDLVVELLEQSLALRTQESTGGQVAIAPGTARSFPAPVDPSPIQQQYNQLAQELSVLKERVDLLESAHMRQQNIQPLEDVVNPEEVNSSSIPWL